MKCHLRALSAWLLLALVPGFFGAAQAGPLRIGASRLDITSLAYPDGRVPDSGYDFDHLFIRAIVLDNGDARAALVGADLVFISPDEIYQDAVARIARQLHIPAENVLMSATHTHSGVPDDVFRDNPAAIADVLVEAVSSASEHLQAATVGFGEGAVYLNVNRDAFDEDTGLWTQDSNPDYPSDKTLAVVAFYGEDGNPIAGYMNYAMHPVNGYLSGFISGDFAGAASRHVEQAFGDDMVMVFSQGAAGDQNPQHLRLSTNVMAAVSGVERSGLELKRESVEAPLRQGDVARGENHPEVDKALKNWMWAQGQVIGEEAIRVMSHVDRKAGDVSISGRQMVLSCPGRDRTQMGLPRGYPNTYVDGEDVDIRLGVLDINGIALASVNAEVYSMIGQLVKKASPLKKTVLVTVANGRANSGYIPSDDAYSRNTFQVVGSRLKPGCAQAGIVEGVTGMILDSME